MKIKNGNIFIGDKHTLICVLDSPLQITLETNNDLTSSLLDFSIRKQCNGSELDEFLSKYFKIVPGKQNVYKGNYFFLDLNITKRCQLKCKHCFVGPKDNTEISFTDLFQFIHKVKNKGCYQVNISGGEPTQYPKFVETIDLLHKIGIRTSFITNGYNVDSRIFECIKSSNISSISVSVDGLEKRHDSLRGKGSYRRAIDFIKRAIAIGKVISVNCVTYGETNKYWESYVAKMQELGAFEVRLLPLRKEGLAIKNGLEGGEPREVSALSNLFDIEFDDASSCSQNELSMYCSAYYARIIHIREDGMIFPCRKFGQIDQLSYGHIRDFQIEQLKNNPYKKLIDDQKTNILNLCNSCKLFSMCNTGCRANALKTSHNFSGCDYESRRVFDISFST